MFKLLHAESKTIIGAAVLIAVFSFLSRMFGLVRDRILAGEFGAGPTLDVYYAAFKVPDLLFSLVVIGALSASFIPLFTKRFYSGHRASAWNFVNNSLHVTLLTMVVLSAVIFVFAGPIASYVTPGFSQRQQIFVSQFMRVMLLAQLLLAGSMVFGSVLQSLKRFLLYALAPILYNIGMMIGALVFVDWMGPIGLAWGVVFGALLHVLVQYIGCVQTGYHYRPIFEPKDADLRTLLTTTGPRMLGIAMSQLLIIVLTILASSMQTGSVTIFQFAYNIQFFPVGIIGVSLAIAVFPAFAEYASKRDMTQFRASVSLTIRQALLLLIPMTCLFLILRAQIVRVVVGAGAFDWPATILTADTLAFFALTFIPQALIFILARAFFAFHDTVTPLTAGLVGSLIGVISALLFQLSFGVIGLAMGYSLSVIVNLILLWIPLRQRLGSLDEATIMQSFMKLTVAGLVCVVVTQAFKPFLSSVFVLDTFFGVFMQGAFAGISGLGAYLLVAWLLKSQELDAFFASIRRKILRTSHPNEPANM